MTQNHRKEQMYVQLCIIRAYHSFHVRKHKKISLNTQNAFYLHTYICIYPSKGNPFHMGKRKCKNLPKLLTNFICPRHGYVLTTSTTLDFLKALT